MGIHPESFADIICFAHDSRTHHVIVCTLCSCYPRTLLGMPPSRINHEATGHELSMNLAEFLKNLELLFLKNKEVKVHDSNGYALFGFT